MGKSKNALLPIFLIVVVDVLGMTIILPLLPFYAERYGASPKLVGLLLMTYALCQLVAGPVLGQLSDRHGRRPLLIVSQVGTFIGFLVLGFAHTLALIFFSRFLDGITAGNLSLAQAYISDVTKPEDRARSFGLIGIAFGIGFMFGPAISGFLAQYDTVIRLGPRPRSPLRASYAPISCCRRPSRTRRTRRPAPAASAWASSTGEPTRNTSNARSSVPCC